MSSHPVKSKGLLKKYLSNELAVRASVVEMTDLVEEVCQLQKTSPSSSVALGRLLVGSVLVASQLKDNQALSFQMSGDKVISKIFAHAQYDGLCRAFISEKKAPMSVENGMFSLSPLIGDGLLQATTYIPGNKQPHVTQLNIVSGEIGEDIAHYLNQSCQIPCLISLAVKIGSEGKVLSAGGVLIELMPGHTEGVLNLIEAQQSFAKPLSTLIEEKKSYPELLENHLGAIQMDELLAQEIRYHCTCSKEKASTSMAMLPSEDFNEIISSGKDLNVDCEMCGLIYSFSVEEVNMIFKKSGKTSVH